MTDFIPFEEIIIFNDGVDYVNVYSRSKCALGRVLSNFACTPITVDGIGFLSVETWWYYTKMKNIDSSLLIPIFDKNQYKTLLGKHGADAKSYFREIVSKYNGIQFNPSKEELLEIYKLKLKQHPYIQQMLNDNNLPLAHYYVMWDKPTYTNTEWTAELWCKLKQ